MQISTSSEKHPLTIAVLGCGARGRTYSKIAALLDGRYRITAAADLVEARRETVAGFAEPGTCRTFSSAEEFFAAGKLAEVLIIGTQDAHHYGHALSALHVGYDLLLEKPAAETIERCEELDALARSLGRRIALGFVLRYTPFYSAVKAFVDSGKLGRVMTMRLSEGVDAFHQAHSYVRGHWANTKKSSPMIVAKCSHDTDLICWISGSSPRSISSYGKLNWFKEENAPEGAPTRCTDGCPAATNCIYDAHRYLKESRSWLRMVMDDYENADDDKILDFLRNSPWGRCVYRCDNDAVDHQVLSTEMQNGITATLTMTAFDCNRTIEIHGTLGTLRGGEPWHDAGAPELWFRDHCTGTIAAVEVPQASVEGYAGHGGGDFGLINALDTLIRGPQAIAPGLDGLSGHRLAYLAEKSRLNSGVPEVI